MNKIAFFVRNKVTNNEKENWGLNFFIKKRFKIKIFNIAAIVRPNYFKKYLPSNRIKFPKEKVLKNKSEIFETIKNLDKDTFVFTLLNKENEENFIKSELNKRKIKYCYILRDDMPLRGKPAIDKIFLSIKYPFAALKKLVQIIKDYNNKNKSYQNQPNFIFCTGSKLYNDCKKKFINSEIVKIPSYNYDKYLLASKKKLNLFKKVKDYAVYLDKGYSHPDQYDYKSWFPPEKPDYSIDSTEEKFESLNNFFSEFIRVTNLDLKIAAHPKSIYDKKFIKFGKIYFNKTLELISKCKIVLLHRSTALYFAVLLKKPLLFLTDDNYPYLDKTWINDIAMYFKKTPLNMSKDNFNKALFNKELQVNKKIYHIFKKEFISDIQNIGKTSYEIIYNKIKKNDQ